MNRKQKIETIFDAVSIDNDFGNKIFNQADAWMDAIITRLNHKKTSIQKINIFYDEAKKIIMENPDTTETHPESEGDG
jgi:hypothetical protein